MDGNKIINAFILLSVLANIAYANNNDKTCFKNELHRPEDEEFHTPSELMNLVSAKGVTINFGKELKLINNSSTPKTQFNNVYQFTLNDHDSINRVGTTNGGSSYEPTKCQVTALNRGGTV